MTITLNDGSLASLTYLTDGRRRVRFSSLDKALVLPVGTLLTVEILERLYVGYKAL